MTGLATIVRWPCALCAGGCAAERSHAGELAHSNFDGPHPFKDGNRTHKAGKSRTYTAAVSGIPLASDFISRADRAVCISGCATRAPASHGRITLLRRGNPLVAGGSGETVAGGSAHPERARGRDQRQRTASGRRSAIARP